MEFTSLTGKQKKKKSNSKKVKKDYVNLKELDLGEDINYNYQGYEGLAQVLVSVPTPLKSIVQSSTIQGINRGAGKSVILLDNSIRIEIKDVTHIRKPYQQVKIEMKGKRVLNKLIRK